MSTKYLPFVEAIEKEIGRSVSRRTANRWIAKPNRYGAILESWIIAGRRMTTVDAVRKYIASTQTGVKPSKTKTKQR